MSNNRKRKTKNPCPVCRMHPERCICAQIPKLNLRTRLSLVIHFKELRRTTNTGMLAVHALTNSAAFVRGEAGKPLDLSPLLSDDYESYVLYPEEGALEIESIRPRKPVHLIVADGNWRQAGKLNVRHPELRHLPRLKISAENKSENHLRKEHFQEGYSTLQAIAMAMGALEGPSTEASLLALFRAKLDATLEGRGG